MTLPRLLLAVGLCAAASSALRAQPAEPTLTEDGLVFPEGAAIPRSLTDAERLFLQANPLTAARGSTPPPAVLSDVRCPGEYEPMQGIIFAWEPWNTSISTILSSMVREITTTGNAFAYIMVDTASEQTSVTSTLSSAGANLSRVQFLQTTTDTIWIRDYGPRYIYEGGVRAIVDHTYNRPRPNDDLQPFAWAASRRVPVYEIPLIHGGGNYHLSGLGQSYATRLINNENPTLTEPQILGHWQAYQNLATTLTAPFPATIDSTQHIDMWMQITGDRSAVVSDWPNASNSTQDQICDQTAASLIAAGWTVARVPAFKVGAVHYTYTNVVMCNNVVLLPSYTNASVSPSNAAALATWQAHLPGKTIRQINCEAIVSAAGVMHCIVMHVPANLGGTNPGVYLRSLNGPATLQPGTNLDIRWTSDDDVSVVDVSILLSTDGGLTFPTVIAASTPDDGLFTWTVPSVYAPSARVRVVARDIEGNTGHDQSDNDLFINAPPPPCTGDADGDRLINFADITSVLSNWGAAGDPFRPGDASGDGAVNFADITTVLSSYGQPCP